VAQRWTRRGLFMKAAELSRLGNFGKEAEGAWERLRIRKLLIIDDLGNEAATEFWKDNFGNLVDARMRGEVKTIITTNLSGPELRERYGERVIRRLTDYGSFFKCEKPADPVAP
jgi:DNA replication protein DnaC